MASTMLNFDDPFHNVNYKQLPTLGHNATVSQFKDKVKLVNDEECEIKVLKGTTITDAKENDNPKELFYKMGENTVFFAMTIQEYQVMVNKTGGTIIEISGDVRSANGWQQTIGLPTVMDSACQLMWHMSKGHARPTISWSWASISTRTI